MESLPAKDGNLETARSGQTGTGETGSGVPRDAAADQGRLRTAHVLFTDIVDYSLLATDQQGRAVLQLQSFVRDLRGFSEAQASGELICIPTGDGMAMVCFSEPARPLGV